MTSRIMTTHSWMKWTLVLIINSIYLFVGLYLLDECWFIKCDVYLILYDVHNVLFFRAYATICPFSPIILWRTYNNIKGIKDNMWVYYSRPQIHLPIIPQVIKSSHLLYSIDDKLRRYILMIISILSINKWHVIVLMFVWLQQWIAKIKKNHINYKNKNQ